MRISFLFILILGICSNLSARNFRNEEELRRQIDSIITNQMREQHIPGLSIAIDIDGAPFMHKGFGFANAEERHSVTPHTLFGIGSCSKAFTAFGVMLLIQQGKVNLNDSIRKYEPRAPRAWDKVTIRQLLSHTSGIPQHQGAHLPWERTWHQVARKPMEFYPGERTKYNNFGFIVLSHLIEVVSHHPYGEFMHEHIFAPLGMHHTSLPENPYPPGLAVGYKSTNQGFSLNRRHLPWIQMWGSGGIVCDIDDYAKWDMAMTAKKILRPDIYDLMWTPVMLNDGKPSGWCLGWQVSNNRGSRTVSKDGGITGYRSQILRKLDEGISIIYLTNTSPVKFGKLTQPILKAIRQAMGQQPRVQQPNAEPSNAFSVEKGVSSAPSDTGNV